MSFGPWAQPAMKTPFTAVSVGLIFAWYSLMKPSGVLSRWRELRIESIGAGSIAALRTTTSAGIWSRRPVSMSSTSTRSFPPSVWTFPGSPRTYFTPSSMECA